MRVACIGGGPGGLYAAVLLKRARPDWDICLYDGNAPGDTFGFGVVFSAPTLDKLRDQDLKMYEALLAHSMKWDPIELRLRDRTVRCGGQGFAAISRRTLLGMLQEEALRLGVDVKFRSVIDAQALPEADLIIAADGAGSTIRRRFRDRFEPTVDTGTTRYIWFATTYPFECLTFLFEENEHGAFAVHAYPFDAKTSTFIVETDDASWRNAGLDRADADGTATHSLEYCRSLFARHLDGHALLSNRSTWQLFRTIRNDTWRHENIVLLGDAAHTAHFSVGSGTKMAMEDALALSRALTSGQSVAAACESFEKERRADIHRIQRSAGPSLFWWENFRHWMPADPHTFAFHFMTRNLKVTRDSLARRDPEFVRAVESRFGEHKGAAPSATPVSVGALTVPNRLVAERRETGSSIEGAGLVLAWDAQACRGVAGPGLALVVPAGPEGAQAARDADAGVVLVAPANGEIGSALELRAALGPHQALGVLLDPKLLDESVVEQLAAHAGAFDVVALLSARPDASSEARAAEWGLRIRLASGAKVLVAAETSLADTLLLAGRADLCLARSAI